MRRVSDNQVVFDSGEISTSKTNLTITGGLLNYGTAYSWQVRYKDDSGAWSEYSTATSFFTLRPTLTLTRGASNIVFSWPTNTTGFSLEYATNLNAAGWTPVSPAAAPVGTLFLLTNTPTNLVLFYRLKK